jgi:hypothetical protein
MRSMLFMNGVQDSCIFVRQKGQSHFLLAKKSGQSPYLDFYCEAASKSGAWYNYADNAAEIDIVLYTRQLVHGRP